MATQVEHPHGWRVGTIRVRTKRCGMRSMPGGDRADGAGRPVVVCPSCRRPLLAGERRWRCPPCAREWPAVLGIPDLRPGVRPGPSAEVARLVEAYPRASFAELVALKSTSFSTEDPGILAAAAAYRAGMGARGRAFHRMVHARLAERHPPPASGAALVIGCGAGSAMLELALEHDPVVGIDPDLGDLLLARKAAEERGLAGRIVLVQGHAQSLPLADRSVDLALAEDVLEHVIDLEGTFAELARVLAPGGQFAGNCVNRYNLLRPEPHVRLWLVGFLPRGLQGRYVRWRRRFHGYEETVRLPSWRELRAAARRIDGDARVVFPGVEPYGLPGWVDGVLRGVERLGSVGLPLLWVFPAHLAIARAGLVSGPQPGAAISARSARSRS